MITQAAFHVGPGWAPVGQSWAPDGPDWGPFGNAAWEWCYEMTFCSRENFLIGGKLSRYFVSVFWTIFYLDENIFMILSYRQSFLDAIPKQHSLYIDQLYYRYL